MGKFKKREYSNDFLEQNKAVNEFRNGLKKDALEKIKEKLQEYEWKTSKSYYDQKIERVKFRCRNASEEYLNEALQKEEDRLNWFRESDLSRLVEYKLLGANIDIINSIIDDFVDKLLDPKVTEVKDLSSGKDFQNFRIVNGFVPNDDVVIRNFATYSGAYNGLINSVFELTRKQVIEKTFNSDEAIDLINDKENKEKLMKLENEKSLLIEKLYEINKQIEDVKAKCISSMIQEEGLSNKIK